MATASTSLSPELQLLLDRSLEENLPEHAWQLLPLSIRTVLIGHVEREDIVTWLDAPLEGLGMSPARALADGCGDRLRDVVVGMVNRGRRY